jgi:hypothetical protein
VSPNSVRPAPFAVEQSPLRPNCWWMYLGCPTRPSDHRAGDGEVPKRFKRRTFNLLRDALPIVAVIVGVFLAVRTVAGLTGGGDPLLIYVGSGLAVLGVAVFFINRWQRKRGL